MWKEQILEPLLTVYVINSISAFIKTTASTQLLKFDPSMATLEEKFLVCVLSENKYL